MTIYLPSLLRLFDRAFQFIKERPAWSSWLEKVSEKYQEKMGHRKLGTIFDS